MEGPMEAPMGDQQSTPGGNNCGVNLGGTDQVDSTPNAAPAMLPSTGQTGPGWGKGAYAMPSTGMDQIPSRRGYPIINSTAPGPNQQLQFQTSMHHHQQDLLAKATAKEKGKQIAPIQKSTNNRGNLMLPRHGLSGTNRPLRILGTQTAGQQIQVPNRLAVEQSMMVPNPMTQPVELQTTVPVGQTAEQNQMMQPSCEKRKRKRSSARTQSKDKGDSRAEVQKRSDGNIESSQSHKDDNADIGSTSGSHEPSQTVGPAIDKGKQKESAASQPSSTNCSLSKKSGFYFNQAGSLNSSKGKVLCCHFSSDGKLLASAGDDKKVWLWNMNSNGYIESPELHSQLITDIRFKPNSTVFGTSSFDGSVQIWDPNQPRKSLAKLHGHAGVVNSLDFHSNKGDLLCSCDNNNEIRLWNINQRACTTVFKGATRQVRFQPRDGKLLAAASGNGISIFDYETKNLKYYLEGHVNEVRSMCWDVSGKYIVSVSADSARVWSIAYGGKPVQELPSSGSNFESCTFHPQYANLVVIGTNQSLELWNAPESNETVTVAEAHGGIVAAMANCAANGLMASASHDGLVKAWK